MASVCNVGWSRLGLRDVAVAMEEVNARGWLELEKVHRPEIQNKQDHAYKKPGYDPSEL